MNYYYADSTNQPIGPISKEQLHSLYRDGTIALETQVILEGTEEWQQYRTIAVPPPPSLYQRALVPSGRNAPIIEVTATPVVQSATTCCPFCAEPIAAAAKKCKHCGEVLDVALRAAEEAKRINSQAPMVFMNAGGGASSATMAAPVATGHGYSKGTAALLAILLGSIGAHKFYLGQTFQGILYLLFCWTGIPTVVGFIEGICYLSHPETQWKRRYCV